MTDFIPDPDYDTNPDQDAFLEFCAENWLDPDSKYAQKIWNERISASFDSGR